MSPRIRVLASLAATAVALTTIGVAGVMPAAADPTAPSDSPTTYLASAAETRFVGQGANTWGSFATNGTPITAWTEVLLNGQWSKSQVRDTDSNGYYVIPLTYGASTPGSYTFRVRGQYPDGRLVESQEFTVTRLALPTAESADYKLLGRATNSWGDFDTSQSMTAWTEAWVNGGWSTSQITTTDSNGNYVIPLTYGTQTPGTHTFRVRGKYPNGQVATSDQFTLKRLSPPSAKSAGTKMLGAPTNAWGDFDTTQSMTAWTEVWVNGGWSTSQRTQTSSTGSYALPLTYGINTPGTYTFRVRGKYANGAVATSPQFTLKRTAGTKYDWMQAAGIPQSDWDYADHIVERESNWNPKAINPYSGACGLAQAYPCSKVGPNWDDPVVSLKWQYNYVTSRYGSYQGAYNFWRSNGWY